MRVVFAPVLIPALFFCAGCGSEACDGSQWFEARPPGLGCTPAPPDHIDPTQGASFDPAHMLCIDVQLDPGDYASLRTDTTFGSGLCMDEVFAELFTIADQCDAPWPKEYPWYPASVSVDGASLDEVGVRRKGFIGSLFSSVPALKIKTDKFVPGQFLGDTERITLNNNAGDTTHVFACLACEIFAAADHPAPRCNLANVMVNGEPLGPYTHIEAIKMRFLARAFGDASGSLYEGTMVDFVEAWLPRFEVKTDDTDPTLAPLRAVAAALGKPDAELVDALGTVLDIDRFLTYWAIEVLVEHGDGYSADRNNFYVYFDPADGGRAVFVPWGIDKTPSSKGTDTPSLGDYIQAEIPRRLSRDPAMAARMEAELSRLITEVWDEGALLASIDRFSAQVKTAQESAAYDAGVEALRTWVKGRPAAVAAMLEVGLPAGKPETGTCTGDEK